MITKTIFNCTCVDISSEGKGVIKNGKDIIFCDGIFPGEKADVDILYHRAGVYFGKVKKLYNLSKDRIQPRCKICTSCGGCQYQQLDYKAQLKYKTKRVKEALTRISKIDTEVLPCLGMEDPYNYRNKIQVPFNKDKNGKVKFGFYKENSHIIMPIKECAIEDRRAAPILWDIKLLLEEMNIPCYNEDSGKGILRYVLIRTSHHYEELMVVLVTTQMNFPGQRNFINELVAKHPEITTIVENVNSRHTNVILGNQEKVLNSETAIQANIGIMRAFVQVREYLLAASSVSAEIKELRAKVDLLQLQQEENLGAVNDLSEDVRQDIDNLYLAIAELSSRIEEKKNKPRQRIGFEQ